MHHSKHRLKVGGVVEHPDSFNAYHQNKTTTSFSRVSTEGSRAPHQDTFGRE